MRRSRLRAGLLVVVAVALAGIGYQVWRNRHIGYNEVGFAARSKRFAAKPGRYVAELEAYDSLDNNSRERTVRFQIRRR